MLVEDEEAREVVIAFGSLSDECQQLLRLLAAEPPLSYEEISEIIGRPMGTWGPPDAVSGTSQSIPFLPRISGVGDDSLQPGGDDQ